jgi:hypothetical protein
MAFSIPSGLGGLISRKRAFDDSLSAIAMFSCEGSSTVVPPTLFNPYTLSCDPCHTGRPAPCGGVADRVLINPVARWGLGVAVTGPPDRLSCRQVKYIAIH